MHVGVQSDNPTDVVGEPVFLEDNHQYDRAAISQYGLVFRECLSNISLRGFHRCNSLLVVWTSLLVWLLEY